MKKRVLILSALIFTAASFCFGIDETSWERQFKFANSAEEFDVDYFPSKYMKEKKNKEFSLMPVTKTYRISKGGVTGEARFTVFKECEDNKSVLQFVVSCLGQISGINYPFEDIYSLKKEEIKKDFNADTGYMAVFEGDNSEFAKGFDVVWSEFFYKKGEGLVMRCFLTSDPEFFGTTEDGGYYKNNAFTACDKSFRFKDFPSSEKAVTQ